MSKQDYIKQTADNRKAIESAKKAETDKRLMPVYIDALVKFANANRIR